MAVRHRPLQLADYIYQALPNPRMNACGAGLEPCAVTTCQLSAGSAARHCYTLCKTLEVTEVRRLCENCGTAIPPTPVTVLSSSPSSFSSSEIPPSVTPVRLNFPHHYIMHIQSSSFCIVLLVLYRCPRPIRLNGSLVGRLSWGLVLVRQRVSQLRVINWVLFTNSAKAAATSSPSHLVRRL